MKLKLKKISLDAGRPIAFLHEETARHMDIHVGDRIEVSHHGKKAILIVDIVRGIIKEDEISLSDGISGYLNAKVGEMVYISQLAEPASAEYISKKVKGKELAKSEIYAIINDISNNALTEAEVTYFVLGVYEHGMSFKETVYLTEAMYKTGQVIQWPSQYKIADKHSIGGIPGNRTTPIIVSICAAAGATMPKTSSRAITSASGTADTIESLAKVDFPISDLKKIVSKTGACLAWGGSLGLAPADDKLIRVERLLNLDPESQLIASIMSKKLAAGSKYVLIDIPCGAGAKVTRAEAGRLKEKFMKIGRHFKLKMVVVITDGSQPIGNGVGPALEMIDVLKVLKRNSPPKDLERKAVKIAGAILELVGKAEKGGGESLAFDMLESKKALKKFYEIINAQGRKKGSLKLAKFSYQIRAGKSGRVFRIDNRMINRLARILGCPVDKGSGIYLYKHRNERVKKGEVLLAFYSESNKKLDEAIERFYLESPVTIKQ